MKIVCYGDSNTYGWDPSFFSGNHYPNPWPERMSELTGHTVFNCGEPGRTVPYRPEQSGWFQRAVQDKNADLLIIMLGTNDLFYVEESTADAVAGRMQDMVRFAKENRLSERLLLLSCPQVTVPDMNLYHTLEMISERYRNIAETEGIDFADPCHWNIPMAFDGVHFSEEGHLLFAERISKHIIDNY